MTGRRARFDRLAEGRFALLTSAPAVVLVAVLVVPPLAMVIVMSLLRIELETDPYIVFVALRNFVVRIPADTEFVASVAVTAVFAALVSFVSVPLALMIAWFARARTRLAAVLSIALVLPWAVAPISNGILWRILFARTDGLANGLLGALHLPQVDISEPLGALVAAGVAVTWRALPLLALLFLVALRQVPRELERAARMDGASNLQALRRVILPAVAPAIGVALAFQFVLTMETFDTQYSLANDQPPAGALLAGEAIYHRVIDNLSLGYGAATSVLLGLSTAGCLLAAWTVIRWLRRPRAVPVSPRPDGAATAARTPLPDEPPGRSADVQARRAGGMARNLRRGTWVVFLACVGALLAIFLIGPIVWLLVASVQPEAGLHAFPPTLGLPLRFDAFATVTDSAVWQGSAVVSLVVGVGATVLATATALLPGYALARSRAGRGRLLGAALLGTQLVPPIALVIPVLLVVSRLGLRQPEVALILADAAFWIPLEALLVASALASVPVSLERAARMDGASRLATLWRVVLPAAAPALAAVVAIVFVGIWNDFVFVVVLGGTDTHTLVETIAQNFTPPITILAARIVLSATPCVVLIALFHRRILRIV
jgi:ABC-type glycerol-3-phosphate transport system permease component